MGRDPSLLPVPPDGPADGAPPWRGLATAVAGLAHLEATPPVPCQDAALAVLAPRPLLVLADGAGSAPASHWGAQTLTQGLQRLLDTLESQVAPLLDGPAAPAEDALRQFALLLVKHARGLLSDAAVARQRSARDLRCTLLLAVVGRARLLWLKVGDGAIVVERAVPADAPPGAGDADSSEGAREAPDAPAAGDAPLWEPALEVLGHPGRGEFANQTTFVDAHLEPGQVQSGSLASAGLTGLALMSDGAAEKLVADDARRVAGQLSHWLDALRHGQLRPRDLVRRLYSEAFCRGTTGDDRSLALLARAPMPVPPRAT